jgi:hypothetical protein
MILPEGPHRRIGSQGGSHTGGSDPPGRATSQDQILQGGGPHRGICFKVEYLVKFEFIFETASGYESGGCGTSFDLKNSVQKILCQCSFKRVLSMIKNCVKKYCNSPVNIFLEKWICIGGIFCLSLEEHFNPPLWHWANEPMLV